jgi:hypothetical protein
MGRHQNEVGIRRDLTYLPDKIDTRYLGHHVVGYNQIKSLFLNLLQRCPSA